jgi:hypothetical protein
MNYTLCYFTFNKICYALQTQIITQNSHKFSLGMKTNLCFKMKFILLLIAKELTPFSHRVYLQLMVF